MKTRNLLCCTAAAVLLMASCSKKSDPTPDPEPTPTDSTLSGEVFGTWTKNSTYHITGDIIIPENKSLTIEEGTKVIFDAGAKPEMLVKGNLYCLGTEAAPVIFTVPDDKKQQWGEQWGGILCGPTCAELLLDHVILEQGGNVTTEASASVKAQFYKAEAGEHVPALWYGGSGKVVVTNSTIRNFNEDAFYIEGGDVLIDHNTFYTTGIANGEAVNIKSGVYADVAFNLIYSPNTNGMKLSNSGDRPRQAYVKGYNNTMINCGWRRPTTKGGSIWLEKGIRADLFNNLLANDRYGIKRDASNPEDNRSVIANTLYYGHTAEAVAQFQPSTDIIAGTNDIVSATTGANDPKFVSYPLDNDMANGAFNTSWDFHLQSGSPALNHGKTDFTPHFATGISFTIGKSYSSPAPATYIGALGSK
ncbi:right-handed parallel beta-helix repeat-containing protein [Taibaiella koreensis]|uniref:right-handed parallel beta-helix repeat-containing protein n=1 Tax=Taibaiella koreensis TaxID=1268548 RepID=UPI000E599F3D|nr:right-handed parallel beta-helix repeat-containing protein [Taibaiella koreensis]